MPSSAKGFTQEHHHSPRRLRRRPRRRPRRRRRTRCRRRARRRAEPRPRPPPRSARASSPTAEGYRLVPLATDLDPDGGTFRFVIEDQDGRAVHDFTPIHERDLHLIVVNRELTTFHHVHPTLDADGTWSIDLPALDPGSYRAVADFQIADGPRLALGHRPHRRRPVPAHRRSSEPTATTMTDGYEVDARHRAQRRRRGHRRARPSAATASSSPTSSPTSARAATSWPCAAVTSPTPTSTPSRTTTAAPGVVTLRRRADLRWPLRPVLRLQAQRDGPHRLVHLRPGPRHRHARHGACETDDRHHHPSRHDRRPRHRRHDLRLVRRPDHEAPQQARRRRGHP